MVRRSSGWIRGVNLGGLSVIALVIGYLLVIGWQHFSSPSGPQRPAMAAPAPTAPATDPSPASPATAPEALAASAPSRGSSMSVVGGISPDELARIASGRPATPTAGGAPPSIAGETPASAAFPPRVQQAARGYRCLCGCPHDLAVCPCNEQPIGAVTMLTYLQKLLDSDADVRAQNAGMVERYGERVLLHTPRDPAPASR
ncbi:MAG: hypothetical protein ACE5IK_02845 [Acidobacteriota bacterium]